MALLLSSGIIQIYDREKKKCIFKLDSPESGRLVTELSLSPNGRYLAFGGNNEIKIFDLQTKELVTILPALSLTLQTLAKKKGISLPSGAIDARKITWAPSLPILAVALKMHEPGFLYSNALVLFDLHMLYTSYKERVQRERQGNMHS